MNYETWIAVKAFMLAAGMKLFGALAVWFIGVYLIKWAMRLIVKVLERSNSDETLSKFVKSFVRMALKVLLLVTVVTILGVPTTVFVAILGAAGLAIGLALQGSLANFAGGILILIFRPFNIGDYIEAAGYSGSVQAIQILYTVLVTPDNKTVIIPNGNLSNNSVINYSAKETRRVDFTFGVSYDTDIAKVKMVIAKICDGHELILKNPTPFARVIEHGDSSVNFAVRVWVEKEDYWTVFFDMQERVKEAFDSNEIEIPYPHMDVNMTGKQ
jgi:small conductance mechanosensitive channel